MEIVFITDVKVVSASESFLRVAKIEAPVFHPDDIKEFIEDQAIKTEDIQALTFRSQGGRLIAIGASQKVQDILDIPFSAFQDMSTALRKARINEVRLNERIRELLNKVADGAEEEFRWKQTWVYKIHHAWVEFLSLL